MFDECHAEEAYRQIVRAFSNAVYEIRNLNSAALLLTPPVPMAGSVRYWVQSFRIDISTLADQKNQSERNDSQYG